MEQVQSKILSFHKQIRNEHIQNYKKSIRLDFNHQKQDITNKCENYQIRNDWQRKKQLEIMISLALASQNIQFSETTYQQFHNNFNLSYLISQFQSQQIKIKYGSNYTQQQSNILIALSNINILLLTKNEIDRLVCLFIKNLNKQCGLFIDFFNNYLKEIDKITQEMELYISKILQWIISQKSSQNQQIKSIELIYNYIVTVANHKVDPIDNFLVSSQNIEQYLFKIITHQYLNPTIFKQLITILKFICQLHKLQNKQIPFILLQKYFVQILKYQDREDLNVYQIHRIMLEINIGICENQGNLINLVNLTIFESYLSFLGVKQWFLGQCFEIISIVHTKLPQYQLICEPIFETINMLRKNEKPCIIN